MSVEAGDKQGWGAWFRKRETPAVTAPARVRDAAAPAAAGLQGRYSELVQDCCARFGLAADALRIEPISLGRSQGREVYVVLMTPAREDAATALRLTYVAPLVEKTVEAAVEGSSLGEHSRFAGVWTHWPARVGIPAEVRTLLHNLRARRHAAEGDPQRGTHP